jgi:16S rRNA processing protein RimM
VASDAQPSFITIARIARTRGNRGEVLADLYTDFPDRFNQLREVWLVPKEGAQRKHMDLEEAWMHKGRIVLKFAGVDSINDAEPFAGYWVEIPADQAIPLPEGRYFDHDLIGCAVQDLSGKQIGIVSEVLHFTGNNQLVVKALGRELLIPAVESICVQISIGDKRITIDPPEGLLDLDK